MSDIILTDKTLESESQEDGNKNENEKDENEKLKEAKENKNENKKLKEENETKKLKEENENENEDNYENENDYENEDEDDEAMSQSETKELNDHLDEIIDKSKSFEDQIKSIRKVENLEEYYFISDFGDKELKFKIVKLRLAHVSNEIDKDLFEQIFDHKFETLADKLIDTTNKEENQIIV